jgi:hypothetical protein
MGLLRWIEVPSGFGHGASSSLTVWAMLLRSSQTLSWVWALDRGGHETGQGGFPPFLPPPRSPVGCIFKTREPHILGENRAVREHVRRVRADLMGRGGFF